MQIVHKEPLTTLNLIYVLQVDAYTLPEIAVYFFTMAKVESSFELVQ